MQTKNYQKYIERSRAARATGDYVPAERVIKRLEQMLAKAKVRSKKNGAV
ncbi:hypothetical protein GCM10027277_27670 [Pseudoduganella ginsengisoli]|uniref:Uncharacterized protein n=1 Tax=Pseudoduganella ginsengisoli TaxID=1462440 RepID=A0A6L6Q8H9_9BURK|nr:hypothetical protein [Pseudoduganella ginsengisoli]MTW05508.1 hypothetical protein [Pseudoduganella ginsengisoli]